MGRSKCWAVLPAGGSSNRFSDTHKDKLLETLDGVPVLLRTVKSLMAAQGVDAVVVAASVSQLPVYRQLFEDAKLPKPYELVEGGATRRESVYNALKTLPLEASLVAVHDAARPLIAPELVDSAISFLEKDSALGVMVALPVHDTVKRVDHTGTVLETLDRSVLWRAQTPQVFWTEILLKAHRKASPEAPVTDDVQLLELCGLSPVKIIQGSAENIKITLPCDLEMAESLLASRKNTAQL